MRINREQFRKWIKALRSGRYKQARGTLQNKGGYCCMGVLCKVVIPKGKLVMDGEVMYGGLPSDQKAAPQWVKNIEKEMKFRRSNGETCRLATLNDVDELDFKEIANRLEKAYPERKRKKK